MGRDEQDNKGPSVIFNNSAIMQSDENEEVIETRPFWLKRRYLVVLMAFFGFFNVYSLRVNLSVAIVSMTEIKNVTLSDGTVVQEQAFDWTSTQKGLILSSFFYGYITTQLIGGVIAAKIGGNRIFGIGIGMTAILTLLTPIAAKTHLYVLLAIRIIEGVFEGVTFPSIHSVWARWAPPLERSRMASIAYAGNYAGTVIAMPASGLLAAAYGWESVFYVFGAIGVVWLILWMLIVRKCPEDDRFITEEEKRYITSKLGNAHHSQTKHISPPWKAMFTSAPVWAIVASHCAENWGFYTLLTQLPTFLSDVFDFHLEKTGFISAVPYLTMGLLLFVSGYLADWSQVKGYLTTTQVRRYFNCTAFFAQTIFMLLAAFLLHPITSIVCITIAVGIGAFAWSGFAVNHLDIAPQYASILMGISNTFAWIKIFTSGSVWAIIIAHFCEAWGFFTMFTQLPTFLKDMLSFDLTSSAVLSGIPYLALSICVCCSGYLADWFQMKGILSTRNVRRIFCCGSFAVQACLMILVTFVIDKFYSVLILTFAVGAGAFSLSGYAVNHLDIAPTYASIIWGISNTLGSVPGIVSPLLTGYIVTTHNCWILLIWSCCLLVYVFWNFTAVD